MLIVRSSNLWELSNNIMEGHYEIKGVKTMQIGSVWLLKSQNNQKRQTWWWNVDETAMNENEEERAHLYFWQASMYEG